MKTATMRCAIYARYSSDLQRDSSIEDQIRKCREFADRIGWIVLEEFIYCDRAISGAAVARRSAFNSMIESAKRKPARPFDRALVDDTSRLARNVADALNAVATLTFHGVSVTFVSQRIDSLCKNARQLLTLNGNRRRQPFQGCAPTRGEGNSEETLEVTCCCMVRNQTSPRGGAAV